MQSILLYITMELDPVIFSIGPLSLRWYGLCWALGFALGYWITTKVFKRENQPEAWLDNILLVLAICALLGARLGHVLFYQPEMIWNDPLQILQFWKGGMASHGGFLGLVLAFWWASRKITKKPILWLSDRVIMSVALTAGLIRVGNFFNQEIVGTFSELPWAVRFPLRNEMFARHPAQLYEAFAYFCIAGLLMFLYWKKDLTKRQGLLTGLFLALTFIARFVIEFWKPATRAFEENGLNMGQWLSIPIVLLGVYFCWQAYKKPLAEIPESPVEPSES